MDDMRIADLTELDHHIRDAMLSGRIKAVLPMSMVEDGGKVFGIYDHEDMVCISDVCFDAVNILELAERLIRMIEELMDILIFPNEIVLSGKVIFIDPSVRITRICVIPDTKRQISRADSISCLLEELKDLTDETGKAYVDIVKKQILGKQMSAERIIWFIEELKREAGMV